MKLGDYGEEVAANSLQNKGYKVIDRNFRCKLGEIDIVAGKDKVLVFVEVKTRRGCSYGLPCEAVTLNKLQHIQRAASVYALKNRLSDVQQRIDVIEVLCEGEKSYIRHMENVYS